MLNKFLFNLLLDVTFKLSHIVWVVENPVEGIHLTNHQFKNISCRLQYDYSWFIENLRMILFKTLNSEKISKIDHAIIYCKFCKRYDWCFFIFFIRFFFVGFGR